MNREQRKYILERIERIAPEYRHLLVTNVDGYVATAAERKEA